MKTPLNNLKRAADAIRLSHDEKAHMRAKIFAAIDNAKYEPVPHTHTIYTWFTFRYVTSFAAVLLLLTGSTAYAAEGALPGSPLYPVKLYVNEGVAEALTFSSESKVALYASRAEERLREAEALAVKGELDEETTAQIEENFEAHVARADEFTRELEASDKSAAFEARVRLGSSLAAHSAILARLGGESIDERTQQNSVRVAARALAWRDGGEKINFDAMDSASGATATSLAISAEPLEEEDTKVSSATAKLSLRTATEMATITEEAAADYKEVAERLQAKAQKELEDSKEKFDNVQEDFSATTSAYIRAEFKLLAEDMGEGKDQLEAEAYEAARTTFADVLSSALNLSALIEASSDYERDFFRIDFGIKGEEKIEHEESESEDAGGGESILPEAPLNIRL